MAAGILLYDVLVNIITSHFESDKYMKKSIGMQALQVALLWIGAFIMALIGHWA